jgi:hypothetical protein
MCKSEAAEIDRGLFDGIGVDCRFHGRFRVSGTVLARLRPITRHERNILLALGLLLLVGVAYLVGRLAFPELWPWF